MEGINKRSIAKTFWTNSICSGSKFSSKYDRIVESASTGLYISADGGENWKKQNATSNVEARPFYFSTIQIDPKDPKRVYRLAYVFSYSTDGGYSKQKQENSGGLSADNTSAENHCTIFTLAESPLDENIIWAGTDDGNLQFTINGGKNWTNVSKNYVAAGIPAQTWVSSLEPSLFNKNIVYAAFDNHMYGDHKTYVAKSTDMGKTWSMFSFKDFTGFAHKIKEDIVNKDLLFLGTEMGLFGTVDGGANWFRMKNNISEYALVRDIKIDPKTNDLILATHGRGIIIVDDISPIRNLTKEIIDKDVYVFNNKPISLTNGMVGGGGFPGTGGWIAGNRPSIPPVQYYLKDRVSSGDVTVEIYDANNKLVQSIPGSKRKGINKVYWNLRMKPPKVATGGTKMDNSGFFAPMVLPGDYTMKLKVGDKEYSSPIKLVHNTANKNFTLDNRNLQYKSAMDIYALHEQLAKVVDDINGKQKMLKKGIDSTNDKKVKTLLTEYNDKLENLRGELLGTKQKSIFADEERLRERISEVYFAVTMQEAAPSNLQIQRVNGLQQEVDKAQQTNDALTKTYFEKAKATMNKTAALKKELRPKLSKEEIKK